MNKFIVIIVVVLVGLAIFFTTKENLKPVPNTPYTVVAFGDSLTEGYGVDKTESYPYILEQQLRTVNPNITVVNMGVSGDTTGDAVKRLDSVLLKKPDVVLLGLGANDMFRSLSVVDIRKNLETIIMKLQEQNIKVVLLGMKTSLNSTAVYRKEFNALYPELAEKYDLVFVEDFLEGVFLNADLNLQDRIHPNAEGYKKIVDENVLPVLERLFN